jgi:hypothetical protein
MAEKEYVKETKDEVVTEKATSTPVVAQPGKGAVIAPRHSRSWVIGVVVAVIALYVIVVIAGLFIMHAINSRSVSKNGVNGNTSMMIRHGGPGRVSSEQTFRQTSTTSDGLTSTSTTTTYTQTQGVVTSVNGDTIVVAGGGKTQTIKTTSATTYDGDTKPAVNDTVIVIGTKDGDTITATQIAVYN